MLQCVTNYCAYAINLYFYIMKRKGKKQISIEKQKALVKGITAWVLLASKVGLEIEEVEDKEKRRHGLLITRNTGYKIKTKKRK